MEPKRESTDSTSPHRAPRAWWELPVVIHIAIPALPGYLATIFFAAVWVMESHASPNSQAGHFANTLTGWAFAQIFLGIIAYPIALAFAVVLTLAKRRCWATRVTWLILGVGVLLWLTTSKILLRGLW